MLKTELETEKKNAHDRLKCLNRIKRVFEENNLEGNNIAHCNIYHANKIGAHNGNCKNCHNLQND